MSVLENRIRALVTGASGKIGRELIPKLIESGFLVYALSTKNSFSSKPEVIHIPHVWGNPLVEPLPEVEVIFHLAGQTSAYVAQKDVEGDIRSNLLSMVSIIESIRNFTVPPVFIFAGSMTEYGMSDLPIIDESAPAAPETFYDVAKLVCELYLQQYEREGIITKGITLRLANVYGSSSLTSHDDRGFLDKSIDKVLSGETLTVYGDGKYVRDYLHISDASDALLFAFKESSKMHSNIYNIGTGVGTSIIGCLELLIHEAKKRTNTRSYIEYRDFPTSAYIVEQRNSVADSKSFTNTTGWSPRFSLITGLSKALDDFE